MNGGSAIAAETLFERNDRGLTARVERLADGLRIELRGEATFQNTGLAERAITLLCARRAARVVVDVSGLERANLVIEALLLTFERASGAGGGRVERVERRPCRLVSSSRFRRRRSAPGR